jgi:hypothetical protein
MVDYWTVRVHRMDTPMGGTEYSRILAPINSPETSGVQCAENSADPKVGVSSKLSRATTDNLSVVQQPKLWQKNRSVKING